MRLSVIQHREETLGPQVSCGFVLRQKPDFMASGKTLQFATNLIRKTRAERFFSGENFTWSRRGDLDLSLKDSARGTGYACPNRVTCNSLGDRVHLVQIRTYTLLVVAAQIPSRSPSPCASTSPPASAAKWPPASRVPYDEACWCAGFRFRGAANNRKERAYA
jgi:hypothetical protein